MGRTFKGNEPNKNFLYWETITAANREWDMYVNPSNPLYINWKIVLASGRRKKANFHIVYRVKDKKISDSNDKEAFLKLFGSHQLMMIEAFSRYVMLGTYKNHERNGDIKWMDLDLIMTKPIIRIRLYGSKPWNVGFNKKHRCIMWEQRKRTDYPLHPNWDDIGAGLPSYDSMLILYYIDSNTSYISGKAEFLRYYPPYYYNIIELASQYLAYKLGLDREE